MPKVHLSAFITHRSRNLGLLGEREVELPCPPFAGLEIVITESERFIVASVGYDTRTGEWFASEKDHRIRDDQGEPTKRGLPRETLEELEELLKEAGFVTRTMPLDGPDVPAKHRHLRLVPPPEDASD